MRAGKIEDTQVRQKQESEQIKEAERDQKEILEVDEVVKDEEKDSQSKPVEKPGVTEGQKMEDFEDWGVPEVKENLNDWEVSNPNKNVELPKSSKWVKPLSKKKELVPPTENNPVQQPQLVKAKKWAKS